MIIEDRTGKMRTFMSASEEYSDKLGLDHEVIREDKADNNYGDGLSPIHADLLDLVTRLRMFNETAGGDFALGVETGMQRAAEMIENLLDDSFGDR